MPARKTPPQPDTPVEELWNLSNLTAGWLRELGIATHQQLTEADLFALWADLKRRHRQVSKLMFYALWGAVHNVHWKHVPEEEIARFDAWRAAASQ